MPTLYIVYIAVLMISLTKKLVCFDVGLMNYLKYRGRKKKTKTRSVETSGFGRLFWWKKFHIELLEIYSRLASTY